MRSTKTAHGELWVGTAVGWTGWIAPTGGHLSTTRPGWAETPVTGMPGTGASVFAIQEDRDGVLWVGSAVGLYHLDPDSQAPTRSPGWQTVGRIAEDSDGHALGS